MEVEIMLKQFVIVPKKPKMSTGKIASQVAHATFMALEEQKNEQIIYNWKWSGMCVIVLECPSQIELTNIARYCDQWDIPYYLYIDEGMTEIPMGTATALATGILPEERQWIFEKLRLMK